MLRIVLDEVRENFLSYDDIRKLRVIDTEKDYYTNCINFFQTEWIDKFGDVVLQRKNEYISGKELLKKSGGCYTNRRIVRAHNIEKIFRANGFTFKKGKI